MTIKMEESWKEQLKEEFGKPYFLQLVDHLKAEKALNSKSIQQAIIFLELSKKLLLTK